MTDQHDALHNTDLALNHYEPTSIASSSNSNTNISHTGLYNYV